MKDGAPSPLYRKDDLQHWAAGGERQSPNGGFGISIGGLLASPLRPSGVYCSDYKAEAAPAPPRNESLPRKGRG
jgi:hypothetical protein